MKKQIFKRINGYSNYLISNYGRVYSETRKKFLIPAKDRNGYLYVNLCNGTKTKTVKIHRLVAQAFFGRPLLPTEDIHHLVSKDDNFIDHIIVLPHSEHLKLHKFGTHHTQETKDKISKSKKEYWQNKKKEQMENV